MRARGFTLLEVMVALALLAISMAALSDLTGNALRNYAYSRDLSVATMLAREKMAELEEKYEDDGFKDADEASDGNFEAQGYPNIKWKAEVVKPSGELSPTQLLSVLAGTGDDAGATQKLLEELFSSSGQNAASASGGPTTSMLGTPAALAIGMQAMVESFGKTLQSSVRELRLKVAWKDGKTVHDFAVTTHLVVVCPKAPGGARGDFADLCVNPPQGGLR